MQMLRPIEPQKSFHSPQPKAWSHLPSLERRTDVPCGVGPMVRVYSSIESRRRCGGQRGRRCGGLWGSWRLGPATLTAGMRTRLEHDVLDEHQGQTERWGLGPGAPQTCTAPRPDGWTDIWTPGAPPPETGSWVRLLAEGHGLGWPHHAGRLWLRDEFTVRAGKGFLGGRGGPDLGQTCRVGRKGHQQKKYRD